MEINMAKGAVLVLLLVAMYTSGAQAYTTYISNQASRSIVATTSYDLGTSQFTNRVIAAGTHQSDQYSTGDGIHVELWVDGAKQHNSVDIDSDQSLVAFDRGDGSTGVDIYKAKYGTLTQTDGAVLVTIYLN